MDHEGGEPISVGRRIALGLTSGGKEYSIIAVAFRVYKNQHDLMESNLESFTLEAGKDPGEVLSHTGLFRRSAEVAGRASD